MLARQVFYLLTDDSVLKSFNLITDLCICTSCLVIFNITLEMWVAHLLNLILPLSLVFLL
jgi:hypothetical protein